METVEVYRAANSLQARLLQSAFAEAGIRSQIDGEYLQGGLGDLPLGWSTSPRMMVSSDDVAAAREIIAEWEAQAGSASLQDNQEMHGNAGFRDEPLQD